MGFGRPSSPTATIVKYPRVHSSLEPSIGSSLLTSARTMGKTTGVLDRREAGVRRNRQPLFIAGYVLGLVLIALVIAGLVAIIFHG